MFRSRPLLDLAHGLPCTLNLEGCTNRDCVPAHSNWQSEGKGKGIKAHDCYFCSACPSCHAKIDDEKGMSRKERREAWIAGFLRTILLLWERGLVGVSGDGPMRASTPRIAAMKPKQRFSDATARPSKILPRNFF